MWNDVMSTQEKWKVLRDGAEVVLGEDCRRQPDWFKDSAAILQPLITSRNALFKRWLHSQYHRDQQYYISMRRTVANSVRKAKND